MLRNQMWVHVLVLLRNCFTLDTDQDYACFSILGVTSATPLVET